MNFVKLWHTTLGFDANARAEMRSNEDVPDQSFPFPLPLPPQLWVRLLLILRSSLSLQHLSFYSTNDVFSLQTSLNWFWCEVPWIGAATRRELSRDVSNPYNPRRGRKLTDAATRHHRKHDKSLREESIFQRSLYPLLFLSRSRLFILITKASSLFSFNSNLDIYVRWIVMKRFLKQNRMPNTCFVECPNPPTQLPRSTPVARGPFEHVRFYSRLNGIQTSITQDKYYMPNRINHWLSNGFSFGQWSEPQLNIKPEV